MSGKPYSGFTGTPDQPNLDTELRNYPVVGGDRAADWDPKADLRRNDHFYQFSLRGELSLGEHATLTSITGYSRLHIDSPFDPDGTEYLDIVGTVSSQLHSFTQELRLAGSFGDSARLKYTLGANYEHDYIFDSLAQVIDGSNSGIFAGTPLQVRYNDSLLVSRNTQRVNAKALLGSIDYEIVPRVTLQAAARYTHSRRTFDGCTADGGGGGLSRAFGLLSNYANGVPAFPVPGDPHYIAPGDCITFDAKTNLPLPTVLAALPEHNVSWKAGISWKPNPNAILYANATRGYKSGSYGTFVVTTNVQVAPVKQERITAYETGFKVQAFNRRIDLSGAIFYDDYRNKQLLGRVFAGPIFGSLQAEVNVPKSRVWGAELSVAAHPVQGLTLTSSVTYVNTKVTGDYRTASPDSLYSNQISTDPACPPGQSNGTCGVNIKGSRFSYTPTWSLIGGAEYQHRLSDRLRGFVGANVSYRSSTLAAFGLPENAPPGGAYTTEADYRINSYALVDGYIGTQSTSGGLRVQLWIRNMFNKYYWTNVTKSQDVLSRITGMPRTFGVTVGWRYH